MVKFALLDWIWVGLYILIMVGAGILFYRLGKRSKSDFFLAGRGLPWWRFNAWGYLSSWIANLGLSWLVVRVLPTFGPIPKLPDYQQFWALMAAASSKGR